MDCQSRGWSVQSRKLSPALPCDGPLRWCLSRAAQPSRCNWMTEGAGSQHWAGRAHSLLSFDVVFCLRKLSDVERGIALRYQGLAIGNGIGPSNLASQPAGRIRQTPTEPGFHTRLSGFVPLRNLTKPCRLSIDHKTIGAAMTFG